MLPHQENRVWNIKAENLNTLVDKTLILNKEIWIENSQCVNLYNNLQYLAIIFRKYECQLLE